jgi:hypothetical protein
MNGLYWTFCILQYFSWQAVQVREFLIFLGSDFIFIEVLEMLGSYTVQYMYNREVNNDAGC